MNKRSYGYGSDILISCRARIVTNHSQHNDKMSTKILFGFGEQTAKKSITLIVFHFGDFSKFGSCWIFDNGLVFEMSHSNYINQSHVYTFIWNYNCLFNQQQWVKKDHRRRKDLRMCLNLLRELLFKLLPRVSTFMTISSIRPSKSRIYSPMMSSTKNIKLISVTCPFLKPVAGVYPIGSSPRWQRYRDVWSHTLWLIEI